MCYAISVTADPLGPYYRYAFERPLFPDYPRPAVWPDGYYTPTSTGDDVIQKHVCAVDRAKMLKGLPATEQCVIIDGANFLNTADVDGPAAPPAGAPNIVMAAGGTQLKNGLDDEAIFAWSFHVDWKNPSKTRIAGPQKIAVAPYRYLCGGQMNNCVPQPGTDRKLDAQGDKIMARLVYRRIGQRSRLSPFTRSTRLRVAAEFGESSASIDSAHRSSTSRARMPRLVLSMDGQPGDRSIRQHRHRLLVWRQPALPWPALCGTAGRRPARSADDEGDDTRGRGSVAGEHFALGGFHADRHGSVGRLHHLDGRLLEEGCRDVDSHWCVSDDGLRAEPEVMSALPIDGGNIAA
jgi:hypothetical protein